MGLTGLPDEDAVDRNIVFFGRKIGNDLDIKTDADAGSSLVMRAGLEEAVVVTAAISHALSMQREGDAGRKNKGIFFPDFLVGPNAARSGVGLQNAHFAFY